MSRRYSRQWGQLVESAGDRIMWGAHLARLLAVLRYDSGTRRASTPPRFLPPHTWNDVIRECEALPALKVMARQIRAVAATEGWDLGWGATMPRPEDFYPPHVRTNAEYIVARARSVIPTFGHVPVTDEQVLQLAEAAGVAIYDTQLDTGCPAFILPPVLGIWYDLFIGEHLQGEARRAVLLHEIGHALGGHFGPSYRDSTAGERLSRSEYDVWEREADLFAALGYLSPAERRLPGRWLSAVIRERLGPIGELDEWQKVRGPWLARTLARRYSKGVPAELQRAA